MSFSIEIRGDQTVFNNFLVDAAIKQMIFEKVGEGILARISLTINTQDTQIINIFKARDGTSTENGASIEASQESIMELLEDAFQLANMGLPPSEIYKALNVSKSDPTEPFERVEGPGAAAIHGFFGVRRGAGSARVFAEDRGRSSLSRAIKVALPAMEAMHRALLHSSFCS